jgi:NADPH:quinone reductase-like Zn-dependent oxidoreductase
MKTEEIMKAAMIKEYEGAIEIGDIEKPELKDDSVLISVHAASVNPIDDILRMGHMKDQMPLTFPHVMGYDVSGEVVEVGKDVKNFKVGDQVFARPNQDDAGAIAQFARVKASELAIKPKMLSHAEAAAVPLAGLTAWQGLVTKGIMRAGSKVLIHGGSGGVGTFAIQIAKHFSAYVATTCSGSNADLVRRLGADEVIDYKTEDFAKKLSDYDLVFDVVGGDTLKRSFTILKKGGTMISIKGQDPDDLASKYGVRFESFFMQPDGAMLSKMVRLIDDGALKPVIGKSYPMAQAAAAYKELAAGNSVGKIVVTIK